MPDAPRGKRKRGPTPLDAGALWSFALKILGQRALSSGELREKLRRKAADPGDVPGVMARLKEYGYLDDSRMAETYAASRKSSSGFGKVRVLQDLARRRVAPGVARTAVDKAYEGANETELIEQFLERKYRTTPLPEHLSVEKNLAAVYRRLRRAGFSSGPSIQVLKRYAARAGELEDTDEPEA
jgi:regulatory protein